MNNNNIATEYDFSKYTNDELTFALDKLRDALDAIQAAEIATCDAAPADNNSLYTWHDIYNLYVHVNRLLNRH